MSSSEEEIESLETCFDMGAMSSSIEPYQFEPDPRPGPSVACTQGSQAQDHSSSDDSDEGSDSEDQPSTVEWYSIALYLCMFALITLITFEIQLKIQTHN